MAEIRLAEVTKSFGAEQFELRKLNATIDRVSTAAPREAF